METIIGTSIAGLIVLAIVAAVIYKLHSDKKKGKSLCGGNCASCPSGCMCHTAAEKADEKTSA